MTIPIRLTVNGSPCELSVDPRVTVLDALRDHLGMISAKKGCDHGQCGACTVLLDGRRVVSCLCLAVSYDGSEIVTAEGLGTRGQLDALQRAFIQQDGLQCGYCTPGQLCSARGMLDEARAGHPSHATRDVNAAIVLTDDEIRERMSGNLCRCGAYVNIVAAIREVAGDEASAAAQAVHS